MQRYVEEYSTIKDDRQLIVIFNELREIEREEWKRYAQEQKSLGVTLPDASSFSRGVVSQKIDALHEVLGTRGWRQRTNVSPWEKS